MEIDFPVELTFEQIDHAVEKVKGTQVFRSIVYQLNPLPDGTVELQFDCIERNTNMFSIGLYSDKEYRASLFIESQKN